MAPTGSSTLRYLERRPHDVTAPEVASAAVNAIVPAPPPLTFEAPSGARATGASSPGNVEGLRAELAKLVDALQTERARTNELVELLQSALSDAPPPSVEGSQHAADRDGLGSIYGSRAFAL